MLREKSERRSLVTIRLSETCIVRGSDGVATLPRARPVASRGPEIKYPLENEAREKAACFPSAFTSNWLISRSVRPLRELSLRKRANEERGKLHFSIQNEAFVFRKKAHRKSLSLIRGEEERKLFLLSRLFNFCNKLSYTIRCYSKWYRYEKVLFGIYCMIFIIVMLSFIHSINHIKEYIYVCVCIWVYIYLLYNIYL